jgi:hypothetical protein
VQRIVRFDALKSNTALWVVSIRIICTLGYEHVSGEKGRDRIEYLGFRFDGKKVYLRNSTLSNFYRKITKRASERFGERGSAILGQVKGCRSYIRRAVELEIEKQLAK